MKIEGLTANVCAFCFGLHEQFGGTIHDFDRANKKAVDICIACKSSMCRQCLEHSSKQVTGTELALYGFLMCRNCIQELRIKRGGKPIITRAVRKAVEQVKEEMKRTVYSLTPETT